MENTPEKEILFENRLEIDDKNRREYLIFKRLHSMWIVFYIAFLSMGIGLFLYFLIARHVAEYRLLAFCAGFSVLYVILDVLNLRRQKKLIAEQTGGKPYVIVKRFYEDCIELSDSITDGVTKADYGAMNKLRESKNLIIVTTKAKLDYVMSKDGFTVGDAEDFKGFINRRIMDNK